MSDNLHHQTEKSEQEVDLVDLIRKLLNKKWFIFKACCIGGVIGLMLAFSIPKEYETTVILAPGPGSDFGNKSNMGQLETAITGVNSQTQDMKDLSPDVYPDIVQSTPFLVGLFDVPVKDCKEQLDVSLYTYMNEHQRKAWWIYVIKAPFKLLGSLFSKQDLRVETEKSGIMVLSKEQADILKDLGKRIDVSVSRTTGVITLSLTMQSPEISAFMADTVISYMQRYIISYRTEKARRDLDFAATLYQEAKDNYYEAQQTWARYVDKNRGIASVSYATTQERLLNEMNLAFGLYSQMAQQLQKAKIKEQDMKPVYAVVQPAVVPLNPSPNKILILIVFVFLALVGACGWVLSWKRFFLALKNN